MGKRSIWQLLWTVRVETNGVGNARRRHHYDIQTASPNLNEGLLLLLFVCLCLLPCHQQSIPVVRDKCAPLLLLLSSSRLSHSFFILPFTHLSIHSCVTFLSQTWAFVHHSLHLCSSFAPVLSALYWHLTKRLNTQLAAHLYRCGICESRQAKFHLLNQHVSLLFRNYLLCVQDLSPKRHGNPAF